MSDFEPVPFVESSSDLDPYSEAELISELFDGEDCDD